MAATRPTAGVMPLAAFPVAEAEADADPLAVAKPVCGLALVLVEEAAATVVWPVAPVAAVLLEAGKLCVHVLAFHGA
jgi:hypothetical protein